jgi:rSAM/selenodomain-associated transferase 2
VRVSIIVPVFNEASVLSKLLDSLQDRPAELIFVDGGSDDGSADIIRAAGRRCLQAPRGRALQMNAGAAAAGGDILLFLHADTLLPRGALEAIRGAVRAGAVGGHFDVELGSRRPLLRIAGWMISARSRLTGVASGDQAIFCTRDAFDRLGGYAHQPLFEDIDLSRRLKRLGPTVRLRPPVLTSSRRWEADGPWRTIARMWALRLLYYAGVDPLRLVRRYRVAR